MKRGIIFLIFKRKKLIFSVFLACFFFIKPSGAASSLIPNARQKKIEAIESKLTREKKQFEKFNSRETGLLTRIDDLEKEALKKKQAVEKLEKKIRLVKVEAANLKKKLILSEQSLENVEIQMAKRLVALYKYTGKGYAGILSRGHGFVQFWRRVKYIQAIMKEDRRILNKLAEEGALHKNEILRMEGQLAEKKRIDNENEKQLSFLKKDIEKKVIRLVNIHKEKEFYKTGVKELELAAQDLKQTLLSIGKKDSYKRGRSFSFIDSKGRLPFPLKGEIIRGNKFLESGKMNFRKGIFIKGASERNVRAIFPGRVDFSGGIKGYGTVIIINHGARYFTISAHLSERKKDEGDIVQKGDVIGLSGKNGTVNPERFYFEIRKDGKNLDPLQWLTRKPDLLGSRKNNYPN